MCVWEEQTYLPPPIGLPAGTAAGPAGFLGLWPRQVAAVLVSHPGSVPEDAGNLPLLGAAAAAHRALVGAKEREVGGQRR